MGSESNKINSFKKNPFKLLNANTPFTDASPRMAGGWESILGKAKVCLTGYYAVPLMTIKSDQIQNQTNLSS